MPDHASQFGNWPMVDCEWPADYSLDTLIGTGRKELQRQLETLLTTDLAAGEVVVAGVVAAYSRKHEALLHRAPLFRIPTDLIGPRPNTTTIGGRALFFGDPDRFESTPDEGTRWLWLQARGLGSASNSKSQTTSAVGFPYGL